MSNNEWQPTLEFLHQAVGLVLIGEWKPDEEFHDTVRRILEQRNEAQAQLAAANAEIARLRGELEYMNQHAQDTDDIVIARKNLSQIRYSIGRALKAALQS